MREGKKTYKNISHVNHELKIRTNKVFHFKEFVLLCHKRDVKAATDGGLRTTRTMKLPDFLCFTTEFDYPCMEYIAG